MQTVAEVMRTVNLIRIFRKNIKDGDNLSDTNMEDISELLGDYETMLLNMKVKD